MRIDFIRVQGVLGYKGPMGEFPSERILSCKSDSHKVVTISLIYLYCITRVILKINKYNI